MAWVTSVFSEEVPTITAIMENGHSSNRVNIVFLSEAYTASMRERFYSDARLAIDNMFERTPYKEYKKFFNVHLIWAASQDSLLSAVEYGQTPKTYFGQFGGYNPNLEIIESISRSFFGKEDPIVSVLIVNDFAGAEAAQPPGLSLIGIATLGAGMLRGDPKPFVPELYASTCAHELAHALAGVQDEYTGLLAMKPGQTERSFGSTVGLINVTTETKFNLIRWKHWIDPTVPIPTPSVDEFAGRVGLFEGGGGFASGWYHPELKCTMGAYDPDVEPRPQFCKVCREAIVKAIYKYVNPLADLAVDVGEHTTTFTIRNMPQPTDHNLRIQWFVDGVVMPIADDATTFQVTDTSIGYGQHTVKVEVTDTTEFVRYDPDKLLVNSKEWEVVSLPIPDFTGDDMVDFEDFFLFADYFGRKALTQEVQQYDLDWNGEIGFGDFFLFADSFGKSL